MKKRVSFPSFSKITKIYSQTLSKVTKMGFKDKLNLLYACVVIKLFERHWSQSVAFCSAPFLMTKSRSQGVLVYKEQRDESREITWLRLNSP